MRNPYEILGLSGKWATIDTIKKAYRKLVMEYHPDRHEDSMKAKAEDIFKEITWAYSILSDEEKRRNFDNWEEVEDEMPEDSITSKFMSKVSEAVLDTVEEVKRDIQDSINNYKRMLKKLRIGEGYFECSKCEGYGMVREQRGFFTVSQTCKKCKGEGYIVYVKPVTPIVKDVKEPVPVYDPGHSPNLPFFSRKWWGY